MTVFPNPLSSESALTIQFEDVVSGNVSLTLLSARGRKVLQIKMRDVKERDQFQVNMHHVKRGVYLLLVEKNGLKTTQKLIIQ